MSPPTPSSPDVGAALRSTRVGRGMSLRALARAVGVSPATLSELERGRTRLTVERLTVLADELGVSPAALLRGDGPEPGASLEASPADDDWRAYVPHDLDPVLSAAIALFVEVGYHGAPVRAIAVRAGLSVPGVYHHYASKHDLLVAAFDLTLSELDERLAAARAQATEPIGRYALAVESLALFHVKRRELAFIGASEMRSLQPDERARIAGWRSGIQRGLEADLEAALDACGRPSPGPHTAKAIVTMCTSLAQWFDPLGPDAPEDIARDYARLALAMADLTDADRPADPDPAQPAADKER